jgi:D-alanine-D-alanine ligase
MSKLRVGWFFGGRSVEHEVSVISALQAYENLDREKYEVIPIYVSKDGRFYSNPKFLDIKNYKDLDLLLLSATEVSSGRKNDQSGFVSKGLLPKFQPIDVAFPIFHGTFGEDGAVQGLFEMFQVPYVGLNVAASALTMDKALSKALFKEIGLPVGKYIAFRRNDWLEDSKEILNRVKKDLRFPLVVKPGTLGSSIGITKVKDDEGLTFAIEVAAVYSEKILIEEAFSNCIEVNCAALGYRYVQASVCEMPVASEELLSFADKYQKGGKGSKGAGMASLSRVIPAPISQKLTKEIQEETIKVFKAIDGCGVIRVDYFVDKQKEKFWINEVNSPPGSLAFYLWEKSGISYSKLLDMLINYALERDADQKKTQYTFEGNLLSQMSLTGGAKK